MILVLCIPSFATISTNETSKKRPTIALVLSGGGFRGMTQIGVLKVLEKHSIPIDYIVGTSIGAFIGGLYASGYSANELDTIMNAIPWEQILNSSNNPHRNDLFLDQKIESDQKLFSLRFNDFSLDVPKAISSGTEFQYVLQDLIWNAPFYNHDFNKLRIPFRAITTDLVHGGAITHREGNLAMIIKASTTIPLRYTPVRYDSLLLVDGGIMNNIPVEPAITEFNPDIIIAVNSTSGLLDEEELTTPWSIADQVVGILLHKNEFESLQKATISITPNIGKKKNTDLSSIEESIIIGEIAALQKITAIKDSIHKYSSFLKTIDTNYTNHTNYTTIRFGFNIDTTVIKQSLSDKIKKQTISFANQQWNDSLSHILQLSLRTLLRKDSLAFMNVSCLTTDIDSVTISIIKPVVFTVQSAISSDLTQTIFNDLKTDKQLFNGYYLNQYWELLYNSSEYEFITLYPRVLNDTMVLTIQNMSYPNQSISFGAKVDNERYGQISVEAIHRNIGFTKYNGRLHFAGGQRNQILDLSVSSPGIFQSLWTATAKAYTSFKSLFTYNELLTTNKEVYVIDRFGELYENRFGLTTELSRYIGRTGMLKAIVRYEKQRIYNAQSDTKPAYTTIFTGKIAGITDTRDNADLPTYGTFLELSLESNIYSLDANAPFSKVFAQYASSYTIGNITVTPKIRFGFADNTLTNAEYFSLGRDDMFYGKREDAERGLQLALGSIETRYKLPISLFSPLYVSMRYDIGSTWSKFNSIAISALEHGIGIAFISPSPLGTARVSMGKSFYFATNPDGIVQGPLLLSFSIGTYF